MIDLKHRVKRDAKATVFFPVEWPLQVLSGVSAAIFLFLFEQTYSGVAAASA